MEKYYDVLGIPTTANKEEIRIAYKKLCKMYNEDLFLDNKDYQNKVREIHQAYNIIMNNYKEPSFDIEMYIALVIKDIDLLIYFDDALKNKYKIKIKNSKTKEEVDNIYNEAVLENNILEQLSEYKKEMILNLTKLTFVSVIEHASKIKLSKTKEEVDKAYNNAVRENEIKKALKKLGELVYLDENQYQQYKEVILHLKDLSETEFILSIASKQNNEMMTLVENKRTEVIEYLMNKVDLKDKKADLLDKVRKYNTIKKLDEIVLLANLYAELLKLPKELMLERLGQILRKISETSLVYIELNNFYIQTLRLEPDFLDRTLRERVRLDTVNYEQLYKRQPFKVSLALNIEIYDGKSRL